MTTAKMTCILLGCVAAMEVAVVHVAAMRTMVVSAIDVMVVDDLIRKWMWKWWFGSFIIWFLSIWLTDVGHIRCCCFNVDASNGQLSPLFTQCSLWWLLLLWCIWGVRMLRLHHLFYKTSGINYCCYDTDDDLTSMMKPLWKMVVVVFVTWDGDSMMVHSFPKHVITVVMTINATFISSPT